MRTRYYIRPKCHKSAIKSSLTSIIPFKKAVPYLSPISKSSL